MRLIKLTLVALLMLTPIATTLSTSKALALSGSDFQAGRIIDDEIFYKSNSMSVRDIQDFLESKVPICDRNGLSTNPSYQPPWTCLFEYQENISTKENNLGIFNTDGTPYQVPGGISAAQIIWDVSQQYGLNPQVLIVMLQKEQGLITDTWPWKIQFDRAMGYACPDNGSCNTQFYGFYNQVSSAAWQLKRYVQYPDNYNYKAAVSRYIQYSPRAECGGTQVYIENAATAALYNYTPYQPNAAALNNMYGSGDGCSSYGNRNFWRYFNDWFGSTLVQEVAPSVSIKANGQDTTTIPYDSTLAISWTSDNATSCSVQPGGYSELNNNTLLLYGITESKTYTITCTGPGGVANDEAQVSVLPPTFGYLQQTISDLGSNSGIKVKNLEQMLVNVQKYYDKGDKAKAIQTTNSLKDSIEKLVNQQKISPVESNGLLHALDTLVASW